MEFDSLNATANTANIGNVPTYTPKNAEGAKSADPEAAAAQPKPGQTVLKVRPTDQGDLKTENKKDSPDEKYITEEEIKKTVEMANARIKPTFTEFQYKIHAKTNMVMIKMINTDTKETIREIPPEKSIDALAKMWEMVGILVDKKR